jgi:hypothetical protein
LTPAFLAAAVERAVRTRRFRYSNEADLHRGLAAAFDADGLAYEREVEIDVPVKVPAPRPGPALDEDQALANRIGLDREIHLAERKLRGHDRVDFLVGECVAVEVKIDGSLGDVTRQIHRYAQSDRVKALVLISARHRLDNQPTTMNGKPLRIVVLAGGFL